MSKRQKRTFKWQINASTVGKLLGYFGQERQQTAIAECWLMNLKRMPRFGATPAEMPEQKPTAEIVQQELASKPVYKQLVQAAVTDCKEQKKMTQQIKETAAKEVVHAKRKYEEMVSRAAAVSDLKELPKYPSKKSGTKRAAIDSFFMAKGKVYHKLSRRTAELSSIDVAKENGWRPAAEIKQQQQAIKKEMSTKQAAVKTAETVAKHVEKQATTAINTTRGIQREETDLEQVQKRFPTVRAGNDRAYFLSISGQPFGGFVIGRIDGLAPGMIFELKHRQCRLFHELRRYEQVQCLLYMKMVRVTRCMLVETYEGEQVYYEMSMDSDGQCRYRMSGSDWRMGLSFGHIKSELNELIGKLNRIEEDAAYRERVKQYLY